jgi:hypothetical protein
MDPKLRMRKIISMIKRCLRERFAGQDTSENTTDEDSTGM